VPLIIPVLFRFCRFWCTVFIPQARRNIHFKATLYPFIKGSDSIHFANAKERCLGGEFDLILHPEIAASEYKEDLPVTFAYLCMQRLLRSGQAAGNLAHDAHIAALIVEHGVSELWTADRDFARFPGIRVRNPFNKQS
jgi:hypothetical protein